MVSCEVYMYSVNPNSSAMKWVFSLLCMDGNIEPWGSNLSNLDNLLKVIQCASGLKGSVS